MAGADSTASGISLADRVTAARRRVVASAGAIPLALVVVVLVGIGLRAVLWLAYDPAVLNVSDTSAYLVMATGNLFDEPVRTAGYPLFMRVVHALSSDIDVTLAIQHTIGIATGLVLYAMVRRIGAPRWAAVAAAAAVLLSLDQVLVEHTILSEVLFTFVLVLALYAAVRALDDPRALVGRITTRHLWLVAAGMLIGYSAWVRAVSAPLVPAVALFFVFALPGGAWVRIGRGALAGGAGAAVLLLYFTLNSASTGTFGMTQATGWAIYSRAAPFADCSQFTPPDGTAKLCESSPADERPGPDFYTWYRRSPAEHVFGYPPAGDDALEKFGLRAIVAQPRIYATTVGRDFLRYFFPAINNEQYLGGTDYEYMDIHRRDRPIEKDLQMRLDGYYDPDSLNVDQDTLDTLTDFQQALRVHPILMLQAIILGALGVGLAVGRVRWALVLILGTSLILLLVPSAIGTYNVRYAIPIGGPVIAAGAIGLWVCIARLRGSSIAESPPATG